MSSGTALNNKCLKLNVKNKSICLKRYQLFNFVNELNAQITCTIVHMTDSLLLQEPSFIFYFYNFYVLLIFGFSFTENLFLKKFFNECQSKKK